MRFLDTNVLVYSMGAIDTKMPASDQRLISLSKEIVRKVDRGEPVLTTTVHLSEFSNIVHRRLGLQAACDAFETIFLHDNIIVASVEKTHYELAIEIARQKNVGINDSVAAVIMDEMKVDEIYSFDTDFDRLSIPRFPKKDRGL